MGLSPNQLALLRGTVAKFLPTIATITRTGLTTSCRLIDSKRNDRLDGLIRLTPLRLWEIVLPDGTDVQVWDEIVVAGMGAYRVTLLTNPTSYSTSTSVFAVQFGTPIICSTKRSPGALTQGAKATWPVHIAALTCYSFDVPSGGDPIRGILRPVDYRAAADAYGVQDANAALVYAQWTNPKGEVSPVTEGDVLILPNLDEFQVKGVKSNPDLFFEILVAVPVPGK